MDRSVRQGANNPRHWKRQEKEPTLDSLCRAKSAEKRWAQPAKCWEPTKWREGVGAWERAKQLPPFICPSHPENEGSVAPAAEECGEVLGVTPGWDMPPPWGKRVSPVGHLFSKGQSPAAEHTWAPTSPTTQAPPGAGWALAALAPALTHGIVFLVLDDDLPQERSSGSWSMVAGGARPASRAQQPWTAWWGRGRSAPTDSGPLVAGDHGVPWATANPPAMWVGPSP